MAKAETGTLVLSFEIYRGDEHLRSEEISQESVTIGKGPAAMLRIEDDGLAELHAVININDDGTIQMLDLGGPGGTSVNNESIQNTNLKTGDEITMGNIRIVLNVIDSGAFADDVNTQVVDQGEDEDEVTQNSPTPPASPDFVATDSLETEMSEDVMAFLMRSGAAESGPGLDVNKPKVLEVAEVWGDTVMEIRHYNPGGAPVTAGTSTGYRWRFIGIPIAWVPKSFATVSSLLGPTLSESEEEWKHDYYVPSKCLPHDNYNLFHWEGPKTSGNYVCNISDKWSGFVDIGDERHSFSDLIESGKAQSSGPGEFQIPVTENTRIVADMGEVVFFGQMVPAGKKVVTPISKSLDFPFLAMMTFFMFIMGMLIFYIEANKGNVDTFVPNVEEFAEKVNQVKDDEEEEEEEEIEVPEEEEEEESDDEPEEEEEGAADIGEEGKVGTPEAFRDETVGERQAVQEQTSDTERATSAAAFFDEVSGAHASSEVRITSANGLGTATSGEAGNQHGSGGSGDFGTGSGGGGDVAGGTGTGTRGRGSGGRGYGEGGGSSKKKSKGKISAAGGQAIILGALDKSLIDKVIKQNQAKFAYCYQRELVKNPELKGKVTLNFTISKTGSVAKSTTYKTTLKSASAEACMNQQMKMLKFPEPKGGGIVIVKYPFIFST